ncbi:MAG: hypothetical protein EAX91_17475 [Candidatus Lokiarchaeota archaeon]|nr:hypothetical protein [Candidatus Lokiarchaeota archaeon]
MRYIFKILLLGLDGDTITFYAHRAFEEEGESKGAYLEWYKEVNAFEDICDLEIDAISDITNTDSDFDEMLGTVDGIIYFINPLKLEEIEVFDSLLHDIRSIKRNIPVIIMYYDPEGILPMSVNNLLERTWFDYIDIEAFVNLQPREFYQALQCLCLAMINGTTPLHIENAWMRFPIYIQLANIFFKKATKEEKPELYFYAAQAIKKAAMIADIFNKEEYFIICEQAAYLYSQVNLYLEASQILQNVDQKKVDNFKRLYAESIVLEGNRLLNNRKFAQAAKQYLAAAQWSAIELRDSDLMDESFRLAIISYISACRVENAFNILNNLPHNQSLIILQEVSEKIIAAIDYLIKEKNYVLARDQLYSSISTYQQEGLFEDLERLANKLVEVLINLLKIYVDEGQQNLAKTAYDEIDNLSKTYNVEMPNLDSHLETLITQFYDSLDFSNGDILINSLNSLKLKKKLTEYRSKVEEENKEFIKNQIEENLKKGVDALNSYIEFELDIFKEINTQIIQEANQIIEEGRYSEAASRVKIQVEFLKRVGRYDLYDEMIKKVLDILIIGKNFDQFFKSYYDLSKKAKKVYLRNKFQIILEKLKEIAKELDFQKIEDIFVNLIAIYREQGLYEQSKEISENCVNSIRSEAMKTVEESDSNNAINIAQMLIKKAEDFSFAYLDNREINFDIIYKRIAEIHIKSGNFYSAHVITDKIRDRALKRELNEKIQNLQDARGAAEAREAEETARREILNQRFPIIRNRAREALREREGLFRLRGGLRRAFFDICIAHLSKNQYDDAIKCYEKTINRLIDSRRLELAGVSIAVLYLLYRKHERSEDFRNFFVELKNRLGSLRNSFSETFSVSLVDYILDIEELGDHTMIIEAIEFIEKLPLFDEEISLLYEVLGKSPRILEPEDLEREKAETEIKIEYLRDLANQISKEKKDIAKRKLMKNQYWKLALEDLSNHKFEVAANEYQESILELLNKNFPRQASVSLILNTLLLIKIKNISNAKIHFDTIISKYKNKFPEFETLPEIIILQELLLAQQNTNLNLFNVCIEILIETLVLFEIEKDFMESLRSEEQISVLTEDKLSREELGEKKKLEIIEAQKYGKLQQKMGEIQGEKSEFLKQRKAMKKRYYKKVINLLENESYKEASQEYLNLAKTLAERMDFGTSALTILFHGLALIKAEEPVDIARSNIKAYLDSLGLNKKHVEETYYILCIDFILDVISYDMEEYISKINTLLEVLPLFDEEKILLF